ncbi:MAG: hypothetical protein ACLQU1_04705 [Bryobacteraceae bacterium]
MRAVRRLLRSLPGAPAGRHLGIRTAGSMRAPPARRPARGAVGGGQATADESGRPRRSRPHGTLVRGSKLADGSSASCGCWRADPDLRQAARMTMPAFAWRSVRKAARLPRSLLGATAGRWDRTSLAVSARRPPAARWAAALISEPLRVEDSLSF